VIKVLAREAIALQFQSCFGEFGSCCIRIPFTSSDQELPESNPEVERFLLPMEDERSKDLSAYQ
jgi:hypothetical protein